MKTNLLVKATLLLCFILFTNSAMSQYQELYVQDPLSWGRVRGNIDEAELTIKPKGVYMEFGLYLTFSAKGSYLHGQANPPLEIVMNFCLPEGSIIHDSWLWVDNIIMQAILIDRELATQIYEGIVNRRKDPSLLTKISDNCYELRVYPLAGNSSRKVKITYLVPARWTRNQVSATIPIDIPKLSANVPELKLNVYTNQIFQNPVISEIGLLPFSGSSSPYTANIPSTALSTHSSLDIAYDSPLQNGIFAGTYPVNSNEGYFQLVFHPKDVLGINSSRKLAILVEYTNSNSTAQKSEVLAKIKEMLLEYLSPTDSFNLFFATPTTQQASTSWLPADAQTINSIFAFAPANISSATNLEQFVLKAGSFVKNKGGVGELLLVTNVNRNYSYSNSNQIINNIVVQLNSQVPVNILNYTGSNNSYYYYYYDNYIYSNICARTGGNYLAAQSQYYDYWDMWGYNYYYIVTSLSDLMHNMFSSLDDKITNYSLDIDMNQGICYSEFELNENNALHYNMPYKIIGKYFGSGNLNFDLSAVVNSTLVSANQQISQPYLCDSLLRKAWAGNFIAELENGILSNQIKKEIIDTSMSNRVLSMYTAFLALEPNDTLHACENCSDDSNNAPSVGIEENETSEKLLSASPNPFSESVTITISLLDKNPNNPELRIYNLMGQEVRIFSLIEISGDVAKITWNGDDKHGVQLPDGVYIAVFATSEGKQILKIVKASK